MRTALPAGLLAGLLMLFPGVAGATEVGGGAGLFAGYSVDFETSDDEPTASGRASASYTGVVNADGVQFALACDVQGYGTVSAVRIEECYLATGTVRIDATAQFGIPGAAIVTATTEKVTFAELGDTVRACVVGRVIPLVGADIAVETCVDSAVTTLPPTDVDQAYEDNRGHHCQLAFDREKQPESAGPLRDAFCLDQPTCADVLILDDLRECIQEGPPPPDGLASGS